MIIEKILTNNLKYNIIKKCFLYEFKYKSCKNTNKK